LCIAAYTQTFEIPPLRELLQKVTVPPSRATPKYPFIGTQNICWVLRRLCIPQQCLGPERQSHHVTHRRRYLEFSPTKSPQNIPPPIRSATLIFVRFVVPNPWWWCFRRLCIPQQCLGPDAKATLSCIAALTGLTALDLHGSFCPPGQEHDPLLGRLSTLTGLQTLNLAATELGSGAMEAIGKLKVPPPLPSLIFTL